MKVLVTGAQGFVGKNLITTLQNNEEYVVYAYDKVNTLKDLEYFTENCDFVVHLAGVNRPKDPKDFYEGNAGFTETLCKYLKKAENKSPILISSSIQAEKNNDYGKSKKEGEDLLIAYGAENNIPIYIYRFSNLFGKWCKPNYNSVIATWCYNISRDLDIQINDENFELSLTYIDDVVQEIIKAIHKKPTIVDGNCIVLPEHKITLGELANILKSFKTSRSSLIIPNMSDILIKKLYSTYLSYLPEQTFAYPLKMNEDIRGSFTEFIKTADTSQVSINVSKVGITKGNHWHHSKNEKFLVVHGEGLIRFRQIYSSDVIEYRVSGNKLEVIDIPTGYTHSIVNVGDCDMVTVMWANEQFDKNKPDTYFLEV